MGKPNSWHALPRDCALGASIVLVITICLAHAAPDDVTQTGEGGRIVASTAPDWPQWRGPRRDGTSSETRLLREWPETGPPLIWTKGNLGKGFSSPIMVGDTIYISGDIGEELVIFALDSSGKEKWRTPNGKSWKKSYPGSRSSGCYDDGRVYFMNAHGRLTCLNAADGKEEWAVSTMDRFGSKNVTWGITESVLVDERAVFVTPVGKRALMAALDKKTGETLWTTPALPDEQATYSSPILIEIRGRRQLINCGTKNVFGVDPATGALLWKHSHAIPRWVVAASPVFAKGMLFISNATKDLGKVYSLKMDGEKPESLWTAGMGNTYAGNVVCVGGMVLGSRKRNLKGWLGVSAETGETIVSNLDMHSGSVVYADGRFYCLTDRGLMVLLQFVDRRLKTVGKLQAIGGNKKDVWAHPVICNGRLYVRYHSKLHCYDIR